MVILLQITFDYATFYKNLRQITQFGKLRKIGIVIWPHPSICVMEASLLPNYIG